MTLLLSWMPEKITKLKKKLYRWELWRTVGRVNENSRNVLDIEKVEKYFNMIKVFLFPPSDPFLRKMFKIFLARHSVVKFPKTPVENSVFFGPVVRIVNKWQTVCYRSFRCRIRLENIWIRLFSNKEKTPLYGHPYISNRKHTVLVLFETGMSRTLLATMAPSK